MKRYAILTGRLAGLEKGIYTHLCFICLALGCNESDNDRAPPIAILSLDRSITLPKHDSHITNQPREMGILDRTVTIITKPLDGKRSATDSIALDRSVALLADKPPAGVIKPDVLYAIDSKLVVKPDVKLTVKPDLKVVGDTAPTCTKAGQPCDDGVPCTFNDKYTWWCACIGTYASCNSMPPLACGDPTCDGLGGCYYKRKYVVVCDSGPPPYTVCDKYWACLIVETCWINGAINPKNKCQVCNLTKSDSAWSVNVADPSCVP